MAEQQELLALLVFIGGLSAATGMVIVETIALSTMVCNDLLMPVLLRLKRLRLAEQVRPDRAAARHSPRRDRAGAAARLRLLSARRRSLRAGLHRTDLLRRGGAVRAGGARRHLLEGARRDAARWRACSPALRSGSTRCCCPRSRRSGWLPIAFLEQGPLGIGLLRPLRAVRPGGARPDHARDDLEHDRQHRRYTSAFRCCGAADAPRSTRRPASSSTSSATTASGARFWRGTASAPRLHALLARFLGAAAGRGDFRRLCPRARPARGPATSCDADARVRALRRDAARRGDRRRLGAHMVASAVKEEALTLEEVDDDHRRGLAGGRLQPPARAEVARARGGHAPSSRPPTSGCKELDRLKDDFISTVTHELRTPLTSIRAFSEILHDDPEVDARRAAEVSSASSSRKPSA